MNSICIDNNMINILSKLKGNKFISYECDLEENWNRTYGFLRINTDNKAIDISVQQKESSLFGEMEDVACIEVFDNTNKTIKESFDLIDNYSSKIIEVNETINKVYKISETVVINNETMNFDMGIVIETDNHKYCFSRENWFNEFIYINVDKDFEEIYPVSKDIEEWSLEENDEIKINRFIEEI